MGDRVGLDVLTDPSSTEVVRGATLVPRGLVPLHGLTGGWSSWMWTQWPVETFIIPALDHMAAQGANVVAFKGGQSIYTDRTITWDEYLARWSDTIGYAEALGMRVYATFSNAGTYPGSSMHDWDPTIPVHVNTRLIREWAQMLAATGNVIGVDVLNEVWIWKGQAQEPELTAYLDAVQDAGLPATYDWSLGGQPTLPQTQFTTSFASQFDFFSFHRYADATDTLIDDWRATNAAITGAATKRAIFGEYGAAQTLTGPEQTTRYESMGSLITADPSVAGALAFAWNAVEVPGGDFGLFTVDYDPPAPTVFTPRPAMVDPWQDWPTNRA